MRRGRPIQVYEYASAAERTRAHRMRGQPRTMYDISTHCSLNISPSVGSPDRFVPLHCLDRAGAAVAELGTTIETRRDDEREAASGQTPRNGATPR